MTLSDQYRFCVAPMMDGTDRHCRFFHRLLSGRARLYTEMIVAEAIVHGDADRLLGFDPCEHPVALQLGGSDPELLAQAARAGAHYGYDEINLNVGCPSDRVQSGTFGACLMKTPSLVADCVAAMREATTAPVTVKCRIGVDDDDPDRVLPDFVSRVAAAGVRVFIIHARKAWLNGLSPKENRIVPPLDYDVVRRLKEARPDLTIVLNGGIETIAQATALADAFGGVMLGRAAYSNPYLLASVDREMFADAASAPRREEVAMQMSAYVERAVRLGVRPHQVVRHMIGLYHGRPGARLWRRTLTENGVRTPPDVIQRALGELASASAAA